ncbi:MAG: proteasome assembly chaperone family protein [Nitrososphaerota archaeon]|nr:proteasome assembly chaperone family protein [Nitrososphaerota archaeon]MDG7025854.1 proteasome assembly chaperone family protein [Nitrososphaerota archaeon]
MSATTVVKERVLSVPRGMQPVLVCGLPGSGYVGKLAADHLVTSLRLKKVAEYTSATFPPQVNVKEDGTAEPPKGELFFASMKGKRSIMVFTADTQPTTSEGEYELSDKVVKFAKKCGVKRVYTLAAYITGSFTKSPKVYGAGTCKEMADALSANGVTLMKDGGISGMNGLLIGVGALRGLEGACLLGETSGYVVDATASKAVLELLSRVLDIPMDTSRLNERAEETQKVISQLQAMAEQSREAAPQSSREQRPGYIG